MRFNKLELISLATNPSTRFDKEGLLIITERQIFWRNDVKLECWCKLRGNLLFYLKDKSPTSVVAGVLVLQDCQARIHNEEPELDGYAFDLDFRDSTSQRLITHSSAERLDWVRTIEACSNEQLDLQIRQLKEQIAVATVTKCSGSANVMGNRIDQGLPLPAAFETDSWLAAIANPTVEAPIEGDLIQF